jgi:hypothetical protein
MGGWDELRQERDELERQLVELEAKNADGQAAADLADLLHRLGSVNAKLAEIRSHEAST